MHYAFADRTGLALALCIRIINGGLAAATSRASSRTYRRGGAVGGRGIGECYGGHERTMKGKMRRSA